MHRNPIRARLGVGLRTLQGIFKPTQIGLVSDSLWIQLPGYYLWNGYTYYSNGIPYPVTGTGLTAAAGTGTLISSESLLNFGNQVVGGGASKCGCWTPPALRSTPAGLGSD